jgi:hypothetical protein
MTPTLTQTSPTTVQLSSTTSPSRIVVSAGLMLGAIVTGWALVMGLTGWHSVPALSALFFLVIPAHIVVLVAALRRTRDAGYGWARQVGAGTLLSAIASPIILAQSLLFTLVLFPGSTENHLADALGGAIATIITGLVASAVMAIFVRARR